jgi:hypothetical protein
MEAVFAAEDPPDEFIVINRGPSSPTVARNAGADRATGEILVFIDADVEVHPDAFTRIRAAFEDDPGLAGLFGSYDDDPSERDTVSGFRNLLHHHVHQGSPGAIASFWAGLGAIRRETFHAAGGFVEHPLEDVELGMRLATRGDRVVLDPRVQGKHLKRWTLRSMVRTDFLVRGVPWVRLTLTHGGSATMLNLSWRHRLSALASLGALAGAALLQPLVVLLMLSGLVALNQSFYRLLLRRRGLSHTAAGVGLHVVHHLVAVCALPTGIALHLAQVSSVRRREHQQRVTVGQAPRRIGEVAVLGLEHAQGDGAAQPGGDGRGDPMPGLRGRFGNVPLGEREQRWQDVGVRQAAAHEAGVPQRRFQRRPIVGAPIRALAPQTAGAVGANQQGRFRRHHAPQLEQASLNVVLVDVLEDVVHHHDVESAIFERKV